MNYSSVSLVTEGAESARPPESIYSGSNSTRERHRERERHRHVEQDAPCYSDTHTHTNLKPNFTFQHFFPSQLNYAHAYCMCLLSRIAEKSLKDIT